MQIFEAIVEKQIMDTSISQVKILEKNIENVMVSDVAPQAPRAPAQEPRKELAEEPRQEPAPAPAPAPAPVKQNSNENSSI